MCCLIAFASLRDTSGSLPKVCPTLCDTAFSVCRLFDIATRRKDDRFLVETSREPSGSLTAAANLSMNFVWNLETLLRRGRLPLSAELKSDYTVAFSNSPEFEDSRAATAWSHIFAKNKLISRWHELATG
jgi:hypothetical protein